MAAKKSRSGSVNQNKQLSALEKKKKVKKAQPPAFTTSWPKTGRPKSRKK